MLIEVSNVLSVNNPSTDLIGWCKKNLTVANPDFTKNLHNKYTVGRGTSETMRLGRLCKTSHGAGNSRRSENLRNYMRRMPSD